MRAREERRAGATPAATEVEAEDIISREREERRAMRARESGRERDERERAFVDERARPRTRASACAGGATFAHRDPFIHKNLNHVHKPYIYIYR